METAIRESDFVVLVCTPSLADKANRREGGVGYETGIVTGELFESSPKDKFIPILRSGSTPASVPSYLKGKLAVDFRTEEDYVDALTDLVRHMWDEPRVGTLTAKARPDFTARFRAARRPVETEVHENTDLDPKPDDPHVPRATIPDLRGVEVRRLIAAGLRPVFAEFWAPWCGPCRMVLPVLQDIAADYSQTTRFVRVNVDEEQELATEHNVMSIPTMIVFRDGKPAKTVIGAYPKRRLLEEVASYIGEPNSSLEVAEDAISLTLEGGIIRVAILKGDGTYSYVTQDPARLGLVYLPGSFVRESAVNDLETLLNDTYATKDDIQRFLAEHQDLILGGEYRAAHSRVFLRRDGYPSLRPDFVLEPIAGELADVVDIQPAHHRIAHDIEGIAQLTDVVVEACARLREYRDYFEDESRRVRIEDEHGFRVFRPRMFIVIGRANQLDAITRRRLETQLNDVKLRSWDEVLAVARSRLQSPPR